MATTLDLRLAMGQCPGVAATGVTEIASEVSPDVALVEAAGAGDRDAFGQLYRRYSRMVHGILLARVPREEAEDLTQEVFLSAMKQLARLREPAAFGGWLAMIARNRAHDYHRRTPETTELPEDLKGRDSSEVEAAEVLDYVRRLPEAYRETLILRLVEGMNGPEIAERTGLTAASVRVNLHRGLKLLRETLERRKP